jgi:hypothetical protein
VYRALYLEAVADRRRAAEQAITQLSDARRVAGLDDSAWDDVFGKVEVGYRAFEGWAKENYQTFEEIKDFAEKASEFLSNVSLVLTVLAVIPFLTPFMLPLVAIVKAAAITFSVVALVSTLVLVVAGRQTIAALIGSTIKTAAETLGGKLGGALAKKYVVSAVLGTGSKMTVEGIETFAKLSAPVAETVMEKTAGFSIEYSDARHPGMAESWIDQLVPAAKPWSELTLPDLLPPTGGESWNTPPLPEIPHLSEMGDTRGISTGIAEQISTDIEQAASRPVAITATGAR